MLIPRVSLWSSTRKIPGPPLRRKTKCNAARYAGVALSLLHGYLASVSAVRAIGAKRSVSKPYFAGLTIDLHSGGRCFRPDPISRSVVLDAGERLPRFGRLLPIYWPRIRYQLVVALLQQSLRLLPVARTLTHQRSALSASPACHAGIRPSEIGPPGGSSSC
jgi:hypothetical protein